MKRLRLRKLNALNIVKPAGGREKINKLSSSLRWTNGAKWFMKIKHSLEVNKHLPTFFVLYTSLEDIARAGDIVCGIAILLDAQ